MINFRELKLKHKYTSDQSDLATDFLAPVLAAASSYDRQVAYFSAEMLGFFRTELEDFAVRGGRFRLLIGQPLSNQEYEAVIAGNELRLLNEATNNTVARLVAETRDNPTDLTSLELLSWLIQHDRLEIKFAAVKNNSGLMHDKTGILRDEKNDQIVFIGTANETVFGLLPDYNYEKITVYFSWEQEAWENYATDELQNFDNCWNGNSASLRVIDIPSESYELLAALYESEQPPLKRKSRMERNFPQLPKSLGQNLYRLYEHQEEALANWQKANYRGVFALCTGAGKTITALHAATKLAESALQKKQSLALVVTVPYQVLAEQWVNNMREYGINPIQCWRNKASWYSAVNSQTANFGSKPSFLALVTVNKTFYTEEFQKLLERIPRHSMFFVGDECHHHRSFSNARHIPEARYLMGLSATPWSSRDITGKEILEKAYGEEVARFGIQEALKNDVLTPYEYHMFQAHLSEEEWEDYVELSRDIAPLMARRENNDLYDDTLLNALLGKRARLLGSCADKFDQFESLNDHQPMQPMTLVYVGDGSVESDNMAEDSPTRDIERATKIVAQSGKAPSQFTARETQRQRQTILEEFKKEVIDVVVAIRVLDEGFDLPNIRTAYLLASSRNERQFIQRRGRILRKAKGKKLANIYDYLVLPPQNTGETAANLVKSELTRAYEFARYANNSEDCITTITDLLKSQSLLLSDIEDYLEG